MEINNLLEYAKDPTKIISPLLADELLFWASSYLTDYEESLAEIDQRVAQKRLSLIEQHKSVSKGDAFMDIDPEYLEQQRVERRIRELKAFKSNVRRRYEILTNKILNKY